MGRKGMEEGREWAMTDTFGKRSSRRPHSPKHGGAWGLRRNQDSALTAGEEWGGGCDHGAGSVERGTPGRRERGRRRRDSERKVGVAGWGSGLGREQSKPDAVFWLRAEWLRREEDNTDAVGADGHGFRTHGRGSARKGKGRRERN